MCFVGRVVHTSSQFPQSSVGICQGETGASKQYMYGIYWRCTYSKLKINMYSACTHGTTIDRLTHRYKDKETEREGEGKAGLCCVT